MPWNAKEKYEVCFFPMFGELDSWRIYVANNEKDAEKAFKNIVSQWKNKKVIVYDAFAVQARGVETIILKKTLEI